jgi:hypothetical protein
VSEEVMFCLSPCTQDFSPPMVMEDIVDMGDIVDRADRADMLDMMDLQLEKSVPYYQSNYFFKTHDFQNRQMKKFQAVFQ